MTEGKMKQPKILLTGGGTGGHIFPLLSIAEELKKEKIRPLFVVSWSGPEGKIVKDADLPYRRILAGKWRRYLSFWNLTDVFRTIIGIFQSMFLIISFWPDVVFAKGGYVTVPVVLAAYLLGRKIITHESDITMGLANRFESRVAKKVCVGYPVENYQGIPLKKLIYTGIPVRPEFFTKYPSVSSQRPSILIMGGSQGSTIINQAVSRIIPELVKDYRVIHLCGHRDYPWLLKLKFRDYHLYDFVLGEVPKFFREATLIVSRAGANTLAEIAAAGKPSILVPFEGAAAGHQAANAAYFSRLNAAVVISQKHLSSIGLLDIIKGLMADESLLQLMSERSKQLSEPKSAEMVAQVILGQIKK